MPVFDCALLLQLLQRKLLLNRCQHLQTIPAKPPAAVMFGEKKPPPKSPPYLEHARNVLPVVLFSIAVAGCLLSAARDGGAGGHNCSSENAADVASASKLQKAMLFVNRETFELRMPGIANFGRVSLSRPEVLGIRYGGEADGLSLRKSLSCIPAIDEEPRLKPPHSKLQRLFGPAGDYFARSWLAVGVRYVCQAIVS